MANSEKDCATDFFLADYLYRAGKNQESLDKVKDMENSACKDYIRIKVLYAYNYDKMGDSLKAKSYMKEFFEQAPPEKSNQATMSLQVSSLRNLPEAKMMQ